MKTAMENVLNNQVAEETDKPIKVSLEIKGKLLAAFKRFHNESPINGAPDAVREVIARGLAASGFWDDGKGHQLVAGVKVPVELALAAGEVSGVSSET
jgi:hypothetical protein